MILHQKYRSYLPYVVALLSLFAALFYNELNIQKLRVEVPEKLEPKYQWVQTPDDDAYIQPALNYYHRGVWKDNNPGRQSYFLRTPGYGLFRYSLIKLIGEEQSNYAFKYIQLFLFSLSVLLLFQIAILAGLPFSYAIIIEIIYGISPFASGFIFYSLTEGITPALMIGYVFFLLLGYRKSKAIYFILAALVLGYLGLTRPVLTLFGAALPFGIYWSALPLSLFKKVSFILLIGIIALAPISIWAIRSTSISGEYVGLHPIYDIESNSEYRQTHEAIWEFQKSYGTEILHFHQTMVPVWLATMAGDTSAVHIDSILMICPGFVQNSIGLEPLRKSYNLYRQSIIYQRDHYPVTVQMPDTLPVIDKEVIKEFNSYTKEINEKHWIWCHVVVPIKLFKSLSFHSNLSLYIFQHTYRGRWWMEGMRALFLLLHFCCCLSFIAILLLTRDRLIKLLFGLMIGAYLFYLCYFFRALEERYTLPILSLMLIGLFISINETSKRISFRKPKSL